MKDEPIEELPITPVIETGDDLVPRYYEIGYLLAPILAVENVSSTVETLIRGTILAAGGQVISGGEPKLIPLAYPIRKAIENKNLRFKDAYFSSLRFTITPDKIFDLDRVFRFSPSVLRFLIIELPTQVEKANRRPKEEVLSPRNSDLSAPVKDNKDDEPVGVEMSQADMDREIEGLLV